MIYFTGILLTFLAFQAAATALPLPVLRNNWATPEPTDCSSAKKPKWLVETSTWNSADTTSEDQLTNGIDIIFATLFQDPAKLCKPGLPTLSSTAWGITQQKAFFLRRLYLILGLGHLEYTSEDNGSTFQSWPFPLASALTQGQRVMIILQGVSWKEFLTFLVQGNIGLYYKRKFSSHSVQWTNEKNMFEEIKIKSSVSNFFDKAQGNLGMNLPLGGIGNPLPNGNIVYVDGQEYSPTNQSLVPNRQLGHLLIFWRQFSSLNTDVLLIGLEGCAPGTSNLFGCHHTVLSGFTNQKVKRSSTGGSKWNLLENAEFAPPAEYGGKRVVITRETFEQLKRKVYYVLAWPEEKQKIFFKNFLSSQHQQSIQGG